MTVDLKTERQSKWHSSQKEWNMQRHRQIQSHILELSKSEKNMKERVKLGKLKFTWWVGVDEA